MAPDLDLQQMREILRLRVRNPGSELRVHRKSWGIIVEVRRRGHVVELARLDWDGAVLRDRQISITA